MAIVSIITPSFNREKLIPQTLDSLLNQTYPHWENIVVDDGSSDTTKDIVQSYADKDDRIKLYPRSKDPKGACTCRNEGVAHCTGEYLVFLDSDDLLEPFCLEQRIQAMRDNPELDFAIFPSLMFKDQAFDLGLWWNVDKPTDELIRQFHQDAICQTTGVIWRKEAFNRIGQWNTGLHLWQDIELFFRAYIQNYSYKKFFTLPPDLHNRRLETSLSRGDFFNMDKTLSRIDVIKTTVKLLQDNQKKHLLPQAKYMLAEVISGLALGLHAKLANELIEWAVVNNVLTKPEMKRLKWLVLLHKSRMVKFNFVQQLVQSIQQEFRIESTLGTLAYPSPPC